MSKVNTKIRWITRTAIFIAILIVVQFVSKSAGQYVTGSLVNLILATAVLTSGFASGLTVAFVSPFFAFMLGIGPALIQLVPAIALGNAAFAVIIGLISAKFIYKNTVLGYSISLAGVITAALAKFLVLWVGITMLILPLLNLPEKMVTNLSMAFGASQLVTALIGGILALPLSALLHRALKAQNNSKS